MELKEVDWDASGKRQNEEAVADGLSLNRVEDGAWDPRNPDTFYFVTTEGAPHPTCRTAVLTAAASGSSVYEDIQNPGARRRADAAARRLRGLGHGERRSYKPDNVGIDRRGNLLIQEDPGGTATSRASSRTTCDTGDRGVVARSIGRSSPRRGRSPAATIDEESSGIIDATKLLGSDWFLFDARTTRPTRPAGAPGWARADPAGEIVSSASC